MSPLEIVAVAVTLANVLLAALNYRANFLFGMASCILYGLLFYQFGMHSLLLLQLLVFLPMQFIGLFYWTREVEIVRLDLERFFWGSLAFVISIPLLTIWDLGIMKNFDTQPTDLIQIFIAAASVAAQYLLNKRVVETWLVWSVVNVVSIAYFYDAGLILTSALYVVFLVNSLVGYAKWRALCRLPTPS